MVWSHIKNSPFAEFLFGICEVNNSQFIEFNLSDPNEMNRHSDWEIDFRQIESGSHKSTVCVRATENVTLLRIDLPWSVHQQGSAPKNALTFGLPLSGLRYWKGREWASPGLVTFGNGGEFDSVSRGGFSGITISIPMSFANSLCEKLGQPSPEEFLRHTPSASPRMSKGLLQLQSHIFSNVLAPDSPFDAADQEQLVVALIEAASCSGWIDDLSTSTERERYVRRSLEFIENHADLNPRISEICAHAGTSWRTLDRSFKERFGVGPKAYLNRYRLVQVRSDLKQMQDGKNISDIANAWGFWHMGQFARDYYKMFGELPSQASKYV